MLKRNQTSALDILQSTARMIKTLLAHRFYDFGLYAGQDRIILSLAVKDGQTPSNLAKQLGVKPPTVTKTIARLQEQGFVTKRGSHKDQRQLNIYLTKDGHKIVDLIETAIKKTEHDIMDGLDETEYLMLIALLKRIQNNIDHQQVDIPQVYANHQAGIF
ncbi:MarR family transcriptional regulator [uncultured Bartonella sp.]|uniref:MarR family winged helix-turn-helix transcriptional regulator n=1 Tax=uncultured Bartonella sp. TaxID=104108 RepID=UPI002605299B|nr:MarR family transcriptional regulator [uncultured Bartonella sp.]